MQGFHTCWDSCSGDYEFSFIYDGPYIQFFYLEIVGNSRPHSTIHILKILKIELPYDPTMSLLSLFLKEMKSLPYLYLHVHCSIKYINQDFETNSVSIHG